MIRALHDITTKHLGWKILSLVLATIIWFTVREVSHDTLPGVSALLVTETRSFTNLPVLVVSAAADVREFKVLPNNVSVSLSANPEIMMRLTDKDIHVTVDLTDIQAASDLRKRVDVSTPAGVTLATVTPGDVLIIVPPKRGEKKQ